METQNGCMGSKRSHTDNSEMMKSDASITVDIQGMSDETLHVPKINFHTQKSVNSVGGLSLYDEDTMSMPTLAAYLRSFTVPGPNEHDDSQVITRSKKTKLGTLLGVYLPTIQHILGVQMFLRLAWIVGIGGIVESFAMVFLCCLCTFLTSISISAIATNGMIDSGGAYFMISRNLGPEFGGAVGVLYYLANAVATAMYLVGGVEILLMYMAPGLPQFGDHDQHLESDLFNNFRCYASGLLLIEFVIVALGVKFVQFFAPISLACVVASILSVYAGAIAATPENSPMICLLGERLLKPNAYSWTNGTAACDKDIIGGPLWNTFCGNTSDSIDSCDPYFQTANVSYVAGIPGFFENLFTANAWSTYMKSGEAAPGQVGNNFQVTQDIWTTFFVILAIFFPSVTGIFTGANMSGDLKDAQKSLPTGTIKAQVTTSFVYLSFVVVFGGSIHGALLRDKYGDSLDRSMVVAKLAWPSEWVLLVGSFTSTFGAALQCLCSAPRLLQSIAKDDVIPFLRPFSVVTGRGEPIRALLISTAIAEVAVLIGGIDYIAPVVDFFFLMCYCFVNLVCALQTLLNAPNWRPRFRFYHWSLSLLGALLCLFIMFATYWYFAIVALIICATIYKYIEYKGAKKEWGDGIRGLALSTAQYSLLRVEESHMHPKNWRPQLLVLVKMTDNEEMINVKLLQLAAQLKAGQGLTIVATLVEGDTRVQHDREKAEFIRERLKRLMREHKVRGFVNVVVCQHASENVGTLVQCVGIGGLRPNMIMVNWPSHWRDNFAKNDTEHWNFVDAIHRAVTMDVCLLVPKGITNFPSVMDQYQGNIDVWWVMHDGGLLLLLPFLLKQHKTWSKCKLRVFAVAQLHDNSIKMKQDLQRWVYQMRIDAVVDVVEFADSVISAYTYERTLMMVERSKLALNYKLSRVEMEHEPQLVVDRSRSFMDLGQAENHGLTPIGPGSFIGVKRVGFKLSFGKSPRLSVTSQRKLSNNDDNMCAEKSPFADSTVLEDNEQTTDECQSSSTAKFFIEPPRTASVRNVEDDNISPPGSPNVIGGASGRRSSEANVFTFSPSDWAKEMRAGLRPTTDDEFSEPEAEDTQSIDERDKEQAENSAVHNGTCPPPMRHQSAPGVCPDSAQKIDSKFAKLDKKKVRKMHSAVKLNRTILERSAESQLVVINLPRPPRVRDGLTNYMHYLDALTDGLDRVLLIRGTGREVITMYS